MKVLIVENLPANEPIWWWQYLPKMRPDCTLTAACVEDTSFIRSIFPLLRLYSRLGNFDAVITHQDGFATFVFAFLNSLLRRRRCRHHINEFITKEKEDNLYSRLKFLFLKFSLSSVYCIMCSAREEVEYYRKTLRLKTTRFEFVPLATDPKFMDVIAEKKGNFIISAGRTGRDYRTLIDAVRDIPVRLLIVADHFNLAGLELPENVEVRYNIPQDELIQLTAQSRFVVLPLQDRLISVGQSVVLQAMALGKALIVTRISATADYVVDGQTGIFVNPGDAPDMRRAILSLLDSPQEAVRIGSKAKRTVQEHYLIGKKIQRISSLITHEVAVDASF